MRRYLLYSIIIILLAASAFIIMPRRNKPKQTTDNTPKANQGSQRRYRLDMEPNGSFNPGQTTKLSFKVVNDNDEVVKNFRLGHERLMHLIVVRKDLEHFQHLHPAFNASDGVFTTDINLPTDGPYRIFTDFIVANEDGKELQMTLEHDVAVGNSARYNGETIIPDTSILKMVDGYNVNYNFPSEIKTRVPVEYSLIVEKDGGRVELEPYLGAMGHSVIIKADTLEYIHTHAKGMNHEGMGAEEHQMLGAVLIFSTSFPSPGIYKTFTQFQHKGAVRTSEYVIKVN